MASSKTPAIITVHDLIELDDPQSKLGYLSAKYLYRGLKRAGHIITVSNYTAQAVKKRYNIQDDRLTVILNAVGKNYHHIPDFNNTVAYHTLKQEYKIGPDDKVVLYVGSDHPRKNLNTAIQAFAQLNQTNPNTIFLKVGAAGLKQERAALLAKISELKINARVKFIGNVSTSKLNDLYNLADALIFPSRHEGFGLPPLQALAAGTPVITSNATSIPEVVGEAAIMHNPDDIDGSALSLEKVLHDETARQKLTEAGYKQVQKFSWTNSARQVEAVYNKLLPN